MKKKKTILSIFVYISILAAIIVAFICFTTWRASNEYVDAYILNSDIEAGTEITQTTFTRNFTTTKISADTEEIAKTYDTQVIKSSNEVVGKYSVGYIPKGTIIYSSMFTTIKTDASNLKGLKNTYENPQFVTLNASSTNAPANGFNTYVNINIANVNAISVVDGENTNELYGVLVNYSEIYTIFRDANNEITNVGIVMEAKDAKMLTTLQDKGTTFRYIEGEPQELSTWTANDIGLNLNSNILTGSNTPYVEVTYTNESTNFDNFEQSAYGEDIEFKNIPVFKNIASVKFYLDGRHTNMSVRRYPLEGGIAEVTANGISYADSSISNGKLTFDSTKKLTSINYDFSTTGLYEIQTNEFDGSYYFIIEDDSDLCKFVTDKENIGVKYVRRTVDGTTTAQFEDFVNITRYTKPYYSTCLKLKNENYHETLEFDSSIRNEYFGGLDTGIFSNVNLLIDTDARIGSYKGEEIENIYISTESNQTALPMFYKVSPSTAGIRTDLNALTWTIDGGLNKNAGEVFGFSGVTKYFDADILDLYNKYTDEMENLKNDALLRGWVRYALTGEITTNLYEAKTLNLTIKTENGSVYPLTFNIWA